MEAVSIFLTMISGDGAVVRELFVTGLIPNRAFITPPVTIHRSRLSAGVIVPSANGEEAHVTAPSPRSVEPEQCQTFQGKFVMLPHRQV